MRSKIWDDYSIQIYYLDAHIYEINLVWSFE